MKWIKVMTDLYDNRKIKYLRSLEHGNDIALIWTMMLTLGGKCEDKGRLCLTKDIAYDCEMLANEFDFPEEIMEEALAAFARLSMISYEDGFIVLAGWKEYQSNPAETDHAERVREQNRERKRKQREREACHATVTECHDDVTENVTALYKSKDKEEEDKNTMCAEVFEKTWILYPVKRGKAQVSSEQREKLEKIGLEEMTRAVERYKQDLQKDTWRKPQNGSTFFNGGYIDYLDGNYAAVEECAPKNKFHDFSQRSYDYYAIEEALLKR